MRIAVRRSIRVAYLLILTLVALGPAHAQSGSAGGSIGNDEKSLSGSREPPRASESERPARRSKPEADEPRRASQSSRCQQFRRRVGRQQRRYHLLRQQPKRCRGDQRQDHRPGRERTSQPERRSQRDQQFKRRHRHQRRPTFRPQRLRNFQAIRWMQRPMDGIQAVIFKNLVGLRASVIRLEEPVMKNRFQGLISTCASSVLLVAASAPTPALAQSGSAGGSIGNDEKSLSGSREAPRAVEPSKPARRAKPESDEPRRASRKSGGEGGGGGGAISMAHGFPLPWAHLAAAPPRDLSSPVAGFRAS